MAQEPPAGDIGISQNALYIESLFEQYQQDPSSLPETWQAFFQGFQLSHTAQGGLAADRAAAQSRVASLIYAYRSRGHLLAHTDPLSEPLTHHPELSLEAFDLGAEDLDTIFDAGHLHGPKQASLRTILEILQQTYCGSVGVEYIHIQDRTIRRWLQAEMEHCRNQPGFSPERRREILDRLIEANTFEQFVHTRYRGQKRFSLEGAETLIPMLHSIVEMAPQLGLEEIVMGMAHRGRLNVLANILDKSFAEIFSEFEDNFIQSSFAGDGDVKYHKGFSSDHASHATGRLVHLSLASNPSHLEAVYPVVQGKARATQRQRGDAEHRRKVLPLVIHGDAAFAGQGVVAETLNLSQLEGYHTGGTVHLIVNNQIGFTTTPAEARSSVYATDVAKMIEAPVFHVNGDDPDASCFVAELALRFRQKFARDVVVDMSCYRRYGHNEADEPAFTQPLLYKKIRDRPSVDRLYARLLITDKHAGNELVQHTYDRIKRRLQESHDAAQVAQTSGETSFTGEWSGLSAACSREPVQTATSHEVLLEIARALCTVPAGFELNPKVRRGLERRLAAVEERGSIDWATAELLSFGSLLVEGNPVRLSGQDSARGTFSQRHATWQDVNTQQIYIPLNHIREDQARLCVYNSSLSEAAVLGFDYGYSLASPHMLVIWEAQFGDFANGAQVIIDQFIAAAQSKWGRHSGIVMLLPHGYEGQGPEHSNAYLERYLTLCAEENMQICNPTTPAQYYHLLKRQLRRKFRRPLVIMSPKSLLRHKQAVSPVDDLSQGTFAELLDDPAPPEAARRLVLCSGKVYYDLAAFREAEQVREVAIVRVEQLYPFNEPLAAEIAGRYGEAAEIVWAQEEPRNRGGWTYMHQLLEELFPGRPIRYVGRKASASPATGSLRMHKQEQEQLVREAIAGPGAADRSTT